MKQKRQNVVIRNHEPVTVHYPICETLDEAVTEYGQALVLAAVNRSVKLRSNLLARTEKQDVVVTAEKAGQLLQNESVVF